MRLVVTYIIPPENQAQVASMWDSGVATADLIEMGERHFDRVASLKGKDRPLCDAS